MQAQAASGASPSAVWLLPPRAQHGVGGAVAQAGSWGLARAARAEAQLAVRCADAPVALALASDAAAVSDEPEEVVQRPGSRVVPRLAAARMASSVPMRLHFHARGALSNLFVEPQPALPSLGGAEVLLRVRAVGLNFRDVLNVLGEYPGDPGPPGADAAGLADHSALKEGLESSMEGAAFGLAHAPLASSAVAAAALLAPKPAALSFEQASTLPVTWRTTHVGVSRARVRER